MTLINLPSQLDFRKQLRKDQTDAEKKMWSWLRNRRLNGYRFFRQYGIGGFVVDFYCPKCRLVIELDGKPHLESERKEYDAKRTNWLKENNFEVIRFFDGEVMTKMSIVAKKIMEEICRVENSLPR